MPTDDSLRLHKRQRIEGTWHQTIQPSKDQAINGTEGQSLRQMPSLDVKLMTKDQDLSFQRGPRPEPHDQHRPDHAASFSHKAETLRDSASLASRIRFPTGTGARIALSNLHRSPEIFYRLSEVPMHGLRHRHYGEALPAIADLVVIAIQDVHHQRPRL